MNGFKYIIIAFIIFIGFISTLVAISFKQKIPLVSRDYYEKELNYQCEIEAMKKAKSLESKVEIFFREKRMFLSFHDDLEFSQGQIEFYCPLGPEYDFKESFNTPCYQLNLDMLKPCNYRVKIIWYDCKGNMYQLIKNYYKN